MTVSGIPCDITVLRSRRKTLSAEIRKDGTLLVRAPLRLPEAEIRRFLTDKSAWIYKHLQKQQEIQEAVRNVQKLTDEELERLADAARREIPKRVQYYADLLGVRFGRITIRCQKTRWGSCSAAGNLNFNCLLMLAPAKVLDSVVAHELCHRIHPNHSQRFYDTVRRIDPDYDKSHAWLKKNGILLLSRMP